MPVSEFSKKTFPLIALMAAAWLPVQAESDAFKAISDAATLREALTATAPDAESGKDKAVYDGYTLEITPAELVVAVTPGAAAESNPDGIIVVAATDVLLTGSGSAATTLRTDGIGDLFGIGNLAYTFSNITFAGSGTGADDADGRLAILAAAAVTVKGDTVFADRFFSANEKTSNAASGGIFYSSNSFDLITLDASAGAISFSGIVTYGDTLNVTNTENGTTQESKNAAAGGAIFLSGTLNIQGGNAVNFTGNTAESKVANAFGGAVYVTSSETKKEDYGIFLGAGSQVNFKDNRVSGESAQGGALILASGALKAEGSTLSFSGNTATARTGAALGGAWVIADGSLAQADAAAQLSFSGNRAETTGTCTLAAGGAVYLDSATFKAAGSLSFTNNEAKATADGTSAQGGALAVAGETAVAEFTGKADSVFKFTGNAVSASGKSQAKEVEENGATATVNFVPEALGGAIAVTGGKSSFAGGLEFSRNTATVSGSETRALGGAIYLGGEKSELSFSASAAGTFSENAVVADGSGTAQGGAIAQTAGALKSTLVADWNFSGNTATGTGSTTYSVSVAGGAIAQHGGTQSYTATGAAKLVFSDNSADASSETTGSFALGGAVAQLSRNATWETATAATFSGNRVSVAHTNDAMAAENVSLAAGGAIYATGTFSLSDAAFTGNTATSAGDNGSAYGGAVYLSGATFSAGALSFKNNAVTVTDRTGSAFLGSARGGALYVSSGTASAQSLQFDNNCVSGEIARGGAAYIGGLLSARGTATFSGNAANGTAEASGGAVYLTGSLKIAGEATFSGNTVTATADDAVALGGAIYLSGVAEITGAQTTLSGNTARAERGTALGGAVYLKGGSLELKNATLSGNSATGATAAGGAIYIDASGKATTLTLSGNTEIAGNSANETPDGITIGNGTAPNGSVSQSVTVKIAPGATFSSSVDANGNTVTTRETFETVKLSDPISVSLKGADFTLEKTAAGGDFIWSGKNVVTLEPVSQGSSETGGKFNLAFRSGTTTLAGGFALTGTGASNVAVDAGAEVKIETGATFCDFRTMNLGGRLAVAGTLNFSDSEIAVGTAGALIFEAGSASSVVGKNTVAGELTTHGNVAFTANHPTGASLTMASLNLEKSGNVSFSGGKDSAPFVVTASEIYFAESGTLTVAEGTRLLLNALTATHPETGLTLAVEGAGTLVLLDKTEKNDTIAFNAYYDAENKKVVASQFTVAPEIKIEGGIFIASGTSLDLGGLSYENVVIDAGTLSASGTSAGNPLVLKTLSISSSATLGDGKTAQFIRLADSVDDEGVATPQKISLNGDLKLLAGTTLDASISLQNYASANLSGEGTLQGDVSGPGNISIARIEGNVSVGATDRTTFSGTSFVSGDISNAGRLTLSQGAYLSTAGSFKNEVAGQVIFEGATRFTGDITNAGKLTLTGNSVLESGSTFTQTDAGTLVVNPGASLDFSKIAADAGALSLNGTLVITPEDYAVGEEFSALIGLKNGQLDAVKITDTASNSITDRIVWNDALDTYVFLGLNGREIETTLYGDLVRENIFRLYDFMRAGLLHGKTASIRPSVFGEEKKISRYMRNYLERKNRFNPSDDKPSLPAADESAPGEAARTTNALMNNVWVQAQYGRTHAKASEAHPDYDINAWGSLFGTSLTVSDDCELGSVFGYNHSRMKHSGANAHQIDIDAYELMGYYRYVGIDTDGTLAIAGAYTTNASERGAVEADFNSWQVAFLAEGGITFRPESWCEIRQFAALRLAYSRTDSFAESGSAEALRVDAADSFAARGTLGLEAAFLPADSLQFTLSAALNQDVGDGIIRVDAYQDSTLSELTLSSREAKRSSLELGANLNYRVNSRLSLYTGFSAILRSGHEEHRADVGVNFTF